MKRFILEANDFLIKEIHSFYDTDYLGYANEGNQDFLNILKNTYGNYSENSLSYAFNQLNPFFKDMIDITYTHSEFNFNWPLTICIVQRAKIENNKNQLLFLTAIKEFVSGIVDDLNAAKYHEIFEDVYDYLTRTSNTKTTHLPPDISNYLNDGEKPYLGITNATFKISEKVKGKSILLIDDIYTKNMNFVENTLQTILVAGEIQSYSTQLLKH